MAASASTTAWRTPPISAGSSPRRLKGWGGDALLRLLQRGAAADLQGDGGGFHRRAHPERWRRSSSATARSATRRSSSGLEGQASDVGNRAHGLRAELRGLAGGDRPAGRQSAARTASTCSRRAPGTICRRSSCRPAATCSRSWAADFTLLAFDADDAAVAAFEQAAAALKRAAEGRARQLCGRAREIRGAA